MRKIFVCLATSVFLFFSITGSFANELPIDPLKSRAIQPSDTSTTTVKVTIVRINLSTNTVVLKDANGKVYEFTVDPKYNIDLSKFKVGDTVTATISTPDTTEKVTRARISKQELIKLQ